MWTPLPVPVSCKWLWCHLWLVITVLKDSCSDKERTITEILPHSRFIHRSISSSWNFHQSRFIACKDFIGFCLGWYYMCSKIPCLIPKSLSYSESGLVFTIWQVLQMEERLNLKVKYCIALDKQNFVIYFLIGIRSANPEYTPAPMALFEVDFMGINKVQRWEPSSMES